MTAPKAFISWSSGKDSAYALCEARAAGLADVVGAVTTFSEIYDRVAMHGVRASLLERQIAALGLPSLRVMLPTPCSNEVYEARFAAACEQLKRDGIRHIVFGDLYLEDIRAYRERQLAALGMTPIFPLWRRPTAELARAMIASGLVAHLVCLDPRRLPREFAGRRFDAQLLDDLPPGVDPCGENGEFHTVVTAGPMFAAPIPVKPGEGVERDGFVFADVLDV
ncbi:MAG: adenine nucleotide alpha hydrolase [Gammaproteobacteria bacterium]|nr:adenine nucleotide alpha hydrolase [Gammaproteobacteria bacterium]